MTFTFDVFVSYASEDRDFAAELVRQLKGARLEVWFAEEQMPAGAPVKKTLARALEQARHGVFVVTETWLAKAWTEWELEGFLEDREEGCVYIPILRIPRRVKKIGPYLSRSKAVSWPEDDSEPEARLWEVLCGLWQKPPGRRENWAAQWRQALGGNGPALAARTPGEREARTVLAARRGQADLALRCDRSSQWGALTAYAGNCNDQVFFLYGSQDQAHRVFFERIKYLPQEPRWRSHTVDWRPQPPTNKKAFLTALGNALECRPEQLAATLRSQLAEQNLVLLHSPVFEEEFEDNALVDYYTHWLPELLAEVDTGTPPGDRHGLKLIQGIAWCRTGAFQRWTAWLLRRLGIVHRGGPAWAKDALERADALAVLKRMKQAHPRLPIVPLEELGDIGRKHVEELSLLLPAAERERFVKRVMHGARGSADILQRIAELYENDED